MRVKPVIAIFDVGKTNKKLFLFDEEYKIVYERSEQFFETVDEDQFPCENLQSLRVYVFDSLRDILNLKQYDLRAINFTTYGASFVYIDEKGNALAPLYNYLKPFSEELKKKFYDTYGGEVTFSNRTASPVLGSLNSGMQLYRIKYEKPELFENRAPEKLQQNKNILKTSLFAFRELSDFMNDEEAYHALMLDILSQQYASTQLILKGTNIKRIFVDGGFSKNAIYMNLIASFFPDIEIFAASMSQLGALGTAYLMHNSWNQKTLPDDVIELKYFSSNPYHVI